MFKRMFLFALLLCLVSQAAFAQTQTFEFADVFTEKGSYVDELTYKSRNLSVQITKGRMFDSDYYAADIYVRDLNSFRHGFPGGEWNNGTRSLELMAEEAGAVIAITGDYAKTLNVGIVYANGNLLRGSTNNLRDIGVIYADGSMDVVKGKDMTKERLTQDKAVWHTMLFGPGLFQDNGLPIETSNSKVKPKNPRTAIGYKEPGHYLFVVVDGRSRDNRGMTMVELAELMHSLGAKEAYNLDGGQSAGMWFNGEMINEPYKGGRRLADMFYITEP